MRSVVRGEDLSEEEVGNTLSSAPESIRKYFPEFLSKIEMVEVLFENGDSAAAIVNRLRVDRRRRFPMLSDAEAALDSS